MTILAVETSCDETSVAIARDGNLLVVMTASQIQQHELNGGIIPELASRLHVKNLNYVCRNVLSQTNMDLSEIDQVVYTSTPGLLGCLHSGKVFAETIALYYNKPLIPINHLHGHVYAAQLSNVIKFPCLSLVISGGHTILYYLDKPLSFKILGQTLDDAVGECYDKVGRMLGLLYPAGPAIDSLAQKGKPIYTLPIAKTTGDYDFSFSGLKSASNNWITKYRREHGKLSSEVKRDFFASFQATITKTFLRKLCKALDAFPEVKMVTVGGGVAANYSIRKLIKGLSKMYPHIKTIIPKQEYCTDNAAMIAAVAIEKNKIKNT